jgi:hypothetical protein
MSLFPHGGMQNIKISCHQTGIKTGIQGMNKATTCNTTKRSIALYHSSWKNSSCGRWFTQNSSFL